MGKGAGMSKDGRTCSNVKQRDATVLFRIMLLFEDRKEGWVLHQPRSASRDPEFLVCPTVVQTDLLVLLFSSVDPHQRLDDDNNDNNDGHHDDLGMISEDEDLDDGDDIQILCNVLSRC